VEFIIAERCDAVLLSLKRGSKVLLGVHHRQSLLTVGKHFVYVRLGVEVAIVGIEGHLLGVCRSKGGLELLRDGVGRPHHVKSSILPTPPVLDLDDALLHSEGPVDGFSVLVVDVHFLTSVPNRHLLLGYQLDEVVAHLIVHLVVSSCHLIVDNING
jgi:hypothetical protein